MNDIYFEDVVVGEIFRAGPYVIPEREMLEFAEAWDPLPIHNDKVYAAQHGGLTAPGTYLLAVKLRLVHTLPFRNSVVASFGYDEVRFLKPVRPGEAVTLELTWTGKRTSRSKSGRGIVTGRYSLLNGANEVVLSHLDTILMRMRTPSS